MGTLIDRFEEHDGPVRCVAFHPTQPLFVSGGDDYTIKVWSLTTRKCIFTLSGHLDYLRAVSFHHELPYILSCSDDQTIRIWNWQNRQEIACLTGHNHYVMSAEFHKSQDLIVSASLDQTVRVWDISGLKKKHTSNTGGIGPNSGRFDDGGRLFQSQQMQQQQDIFGNTDAVVKFVLEGHDRGVNYATFHPTLPLIASAADDRVVKLWRMSESKAWEVDTCRGHTNNVWSVTFHPTQDLIISCSEDKTIRVWDLNKRTSIKQYTRENDRFWMIHSHPNMNLFAAAHDSGVMVFKLERERPAYTINTSSNTMFFVNNDRNVQSFLFANGRASMPMLSLKKIGKPWSMFRSISYNASANSILVTTGPEDHAMYALLKLPEDITGAIEPLDLKQADSDFAVFIARNRFVTYSKSDKELCVRDLNNKITKSIKLDNDDEIKDILSAAPGQILLLKQHSVVLYDVPQKKLLYELQVSNVKYVLWSTDMKYCALLSKHTITIVDSAFNIVTSMHETIRIKSATWDNTGVLIYSTLNHIKYTLLNGDNGIIKTLPNTVYIVHVVGQHVFCLTRSGTVEMITIDPTEYRFKKALVNKNFPEVLRIINNSNLVGQNIISYLQQKGYPEIALQFVEDHETRFELALECGNLKTALHEAQEMKNGSAWLKLGEAAIAKGDLQIVEMCYQDQKLFDKLSFFYLILGDHHKLRKMQTIAEHRNDATSVLQNSIYLNNTEKRCQVFAEAGQLSLGYAIAKANGHSDFANQILEASEITENDIEWPEDVEENLSIPKVMRTLPEGKWPLKPSEPSFFEKALAGQLDELQLEDTGKASESINTESGISKGIDDDLFKDEDEDVNEANEAWGDDDEILVDIDEEPAAQRQEEEEEEDFGPFSGPVANWIKNSPNNAAVQAALGQFEAAAELLNHQVGVVDIEPLQPRMNEIYDANKDFLADGASSIPSSPVIPGFDTLESKFQEAFRLFKVNKLNEAIEMFRNIIYTVTVLKVDYEDEEHKCIEALHLCREYILGLSIELARRALPTDNVKRNLELAAYFTKANLKPVHRVNALQVAMNQSFKNKNYLLASYFAAEFLKIVGTGGRSEQAKKIKAKADSILENAINIDFDPSLDFSICAYTYTPIYADTPQVAEALVGAVYNASEEGKVCNITKITEIGASCTKLCLM